MDIKQSKIPRGLVGSAMVGFTLVVVAWTGAPKTETAPTGTESPATSALSVFVNIPLSEIEDGQFCQAYANVTGGTPPYKFEWSGQFTDADIDGTAFSPLGVGQVVNGYINGGGSHWLRVDVTDTIGSGGTGHDTAILTIGDDFNDDCWG